MDSGATTSGLSIIDLCCQQDIPSNSSYARGSDWLKSKHTGTHPKASVFSKVTVDEPSKHSITLMVLSTGKAILSIPGSAGVVWLSLQIEAKCRLSLYKKVVKQKHYLIYMSLTTTFTC